MRAWSVAWQEAAFGPEGFYRRDPGHAERHFATHVTDDDRTARRLLSTAVPMLRELASQGRGVVVTDIGAGDGTLLSQLVDLCPADLIDAVTWRGLDVRERPPRLTDRVRWVRGDIRAMAAQLPAECGLVIAHELLDDIPCDVLECDDDGRLRLVLVDPATGRQEPGPALDDAAGCTSFGIAAEPLLAWAANWWPRRTPVGRIEVGLPRDAVWRQVTSLVATGLAVAIDYGHLRADRRRGGWDGGTLAGYRDGRLVTPVPDGTCNITAHVAMDSCAAVVGARTSLLTRSGDSDDFAWLVQEIAR